MNRINSISIDAEAAVALTTQTIIKRCEDFVKDSPGLQRIPWLATEAIDPQYADDWVKPNLKPDDLGLIQYTSGSTGNPKGVMITHQNLLANCRLITKSFRMEPVYGTCISWLPLYHDMGLVGGILNPRIRLVHDEDHTRRLRRTRPVILEARLQRSRAGA